MTDLKDGQRHGVGERFLAVNKSASRPSIYIDAGQSVHLGVDPVQTLVDYVCPERNTIRRFIDICLI